MQIPTLPIEIAKRNFAGICLSSTPELVSVIARFRDGQRVVAPCFPKSLL